MKRNAFVTFFALLLLSFSAVIQLSAAVGEEHWSPQFGWPGTTNTVSAFARHNGRL